MGLFWLYLLPYPYRLAVEGVGGSASVAAMLVSIELPLALTVLVFLAIPFTRHVRDVRWAPVVSGLLGTAGMAALQAPASLANLSVALQACGVFLVACFIATGLPVWGNALTCQGGRQSSALARCALSVALGDALIGCLFLMTSQVRALVLLAAPLVSMSFAISAGSDDDVAPGDGESGQGQLPPLFVTSAILVVFNSFFALVLNTVEGQDCAGDRTATALVSCLTMVVVTLVYLRVGNGRGGSIIAFALMLAAYLVALLAVLLTSGSKAPVDHQLWVAAGISFKGLAFVTACSATPRVSREDGAVCTPLSIFGVAFVSVPFLVSLSAPWSTSLILSAFVSVDSVLKVAQLALFAVAISSVLVMSVRAYRLAEGAPAGSSDVAGAMQPPDPNERLLELGSHVGLSERELQVLSYLTRGYGARAIAEKLSLSEHTVNNHISSAYRKIGIHSRRELLTLLEGDSEQ